MIKIYRKIMGGEAWNVAAHTESPGWETWDCDDHSLDEAVGTLFCYIDIHECDGDPASAWKVEIDGKIEVEVDARAMSPEERASCPQEIRERGRAIFGETIKDSVDAALRGIEESSNRGESR